MNLFIVNNISAGIKASQDNKYENIYFCPIVHSDVQRAFWDKRFDYLKETIPSAKWVVLTDKTVTLDDHIAGWDAWAEKQYYGHAHLLRQNYLFDELPFECPDGFTSFRKKAEKYLPELYRDAITPKDEELLKELSYYFYDSKLPSSYFDDRNGMVGREYSTKLSPYFSSGALDVRYFYNEVRDYEVREGSNKSTYWLIFEILWREFFYWHYQKHQTAFFAKEGLTPPYIFDDFEELYEDDLEKCLQKNPLALACLRELVQTGFLGNRARQIFASYLLNVEKIDWRSGADLFEVFLVDYDVYSNYGNWLYLAGKGVDPRAKEGEIRFFNPVTQLKRYNSDCSYVKKWVPELSDKSIPEILRLCEVKLI